ncbi:hypothetical protein [Bdellovibrio bacteriovorus]|uniref:hypothetical protein n=1 Tax=Bdellovibrio bacteriovorus TaxID=959 RepID=UPI003A80E205
MRKFIVLAALSLMFSVTVQAKQKAMLIAASKGNDITVMDKNTKIPVNVLYGKNVCYIGTPEEAEEILLKTVENRGLALNSLRAWDNRGKIILYAEIQLEIQATEEIVLSPCSK